MSKPFKTIEEQIALLNMRGVKTDLNTPAVLLRESYYSIVNGYKEPFIDQDASNAAQDDRYKKETEFSDLHSLFKFDRNLRETTFHYLIRAEALVRTVCAYTFSEAHRDPDSYLDQANFASEKEYTEYGLANYRFNLQKLHSELFNKANRSKREFIEHYRNNHSSVPLWVLSNDMTFGNIEHFCNLMKPDEQSLVCRRIVEATGKTGSKYGFFSTKEMRIGLDILVKFRNICAHDERLYCAKVGGRKNVDYVRMLTYLRRYVTEAEFAELIGRIATLVDEFSNESAAVSHVLMKMGFGKIEAE
ncbi:MAG: Abi family protein [Slackia sp.]|nr:Abi family protein [Slackia sp.]